MDIIILSLIFMALVVIIVLVSRTKTDNKKEVVNGILKAMSEPKPIDVLSLFHPKVWDAYKEYINNPDSWRSSHCTITNGVDQIWAANNVENRRFYSSGSIRDREAEYERINRSLTHYDQMLMDRLCKAVANRETTISLKILM